MCAAVVHLSENSAPSEEEIQLCLRCMPRNLSNHNTVRRSSSIDDLSEFLRSWKRTNTSELENELFVYGKSHISPNKEEEQAANLLLSKGSMSSGLFSLLSSNHRSALKKTTPAVTNQFTSIPKSSLNRSVRFADVMGKKLQTVKFFTADNEPPKIPSSVLNHLDLQTDLVYAHQGLKYFSPQYLNPASNPEFPQLLKSRYVCLGSAMIMRSLLTGIVHVFNLTYEKSVTIRCTFNKWSTFTDFSAAYVIASSDGESDQFGFSLVLPPSLVVGSTIEFAIRYVAGGVGECGTYWDNNDGKNYTFECFAKTAALSNDKAWMHFL